MLIDVVGWAAAIVGVANSMSIFHQASHCLIGGLPWFTRRGPGQPSWQPGTFGMSSFRWLSRLWANYLWLLYGVVLDKLPMIFLSYWFITGIALLVLIMAIYPPRRTATERAAIWISLGLTLLVLWISTLGSTALSPYYYLVRASFGLVVTGMMVPGEIHQIAAMLKTRGAGRQTLLECITGTADWGLWALYGTLLGKLEMALSCGLIMGLFVMRGILIGRDPERRK